MMTCGVCTGRSRDANNNPSKPSHSPIEYNLGQQWDTCRLLRQIDRLQRRCAELERVNDDHGPGIMTDRWSKCISNFGLIPRGFGGQEIRDRINSHYFRISACTTILQLCVSDTFALSVTSQHIRVSWNGSGYSISIAIDRQKLPDESTLANTAFGLLC